MHYSATLSGERHLQYRHGSIPHALVEVLYLHGTGAQLQLMGAGTKKPPDAPRYNIVIGFGTTSSSTSFLWREQGATHLGGTTPAPSYGPVCVVAVWEYFQHDEDKG